MPTDAALAPARATRTMLDGKIALVTGGGSGIGRASALALAAAGADVTIADLNPEGGEAVAAEIRALGGTARVIATDATDEAQIAAAIEAVVRAHGRLDLALNNIGRGELGRTIVTTTAEKWDWILTMSLKSTWLAMKHEIPAMAAGGGGAIVNMASTAGMATQLTASPAYAAAKAGVIHLTRYAARAHAAEGIRVNSVAPGLTLTPTVEAWFSEEDRAATCAANQYVDRATLPEEVAAAVLFLLSPAAAMITGTNTPVCGGLV